MDQLCALDDLFTARLTHCAVCHRPRSPLEVDVWPLPGARAVAYGLCLRCLGEPGSQTALRTLLTQRYAKETV